jgi:hypothetical protein
MLPGQRAHRFMNHEAIGKLNICIGNRNDADQYACFALLQVVCR